MNQLQYEASPYLTAMGADPIRWLPWGGEAFALAQAEHKPLRIHIGTTPFPAPPQGTGTAARLTERYFVPVCVDGAELPHVAAMYTKAAALLVGRRELPLEIIADEHGVPFFAAGQLREIELAGLLSGIALNRSSDPDAYAQTAAVMARLLADTAEEPQAHCETGELSEQTLTEIALSSIRDHIGGGFFSESELPHKRLRDQAEWLDAYTRAWQRTGTELYRRVAMETADFVIRELRHGAGGFYTAQWSEDGFHLLNEADVYAVLGQNDGSVFCREYSIGEAPTLPHLLGGEEPTEDTVLLHDLRMKLYRYRLQRGAPRRDDMIQTGENGRMIATLARAGRGLGVERYITAAVNAEEFLRSRLVSPSDLRRYYCHGTAVGDGVLGDYAGYAMGLLELYRCGCGTEYLHHGARVMARADALFSDREGGGWYLARGDGNLPFRPKADDRSQTLGVWVLTELAKELPHPSLRKRVQEAVLK